jgi:hypothetical protein
MYTYAKENIKLKIEISVADRDVYPGSRIQDPDPGSSA